MQTSQTLVIPWTPTSPTVGEINLPDVAQALSDIPTKATLAFANGVSVEAKLLKELANHLGRIAKQVIIKLTSQHVVLETPDGRNTARLAMRVPTKNIYAVHLVTADKIAPPVKYTSQDIEKVKWALKAADKRNEPFSSALIHEGWIAALDGRNMRIARAPEGLETPNGAYHLTFGNGTIIATEHEYSQVISTSILPVVEASGVENVSAEIELDVLLNACYKQQVMRIEIDGARFEFDSAPVVDALGKIKGVKYIQVRFGTGTKANISFQATDRVLVCGGARTDPNRVYPEDEPILKTGASKDIVLGSVPEADIAPIHWEVVEIYMPRTEYANPWGLLPDPR